MITTAISVVLFALMGWANWAGFRSLPAGLPWWVAALWWLPLAAMVVLTGYFVIMLSLPAMWSVVVMFLVVGLPQVVYSLCSLFSWRLGLVVALAMAGTALYGSIGGWRRLQVRHVEFAHADVPREFDGYRIVQVSDLHIGTCVLSPSMVRRVVDMVNGLEPDLIAFTGDLVNTLPSEVEPFEAELSRLSAPDGVVSVLGNHDYCPYVRFANARRRPLLIRRVQEAERRMGWRLLMNENMVIGRGGDSLAIVGVENDSASPRSRRADLGKALRGLPQGMMQVMLTHDPTHWRRAVLPQTEAQLTLSGHTHAMQLKVAGWSPSSWLFREWGGVYAEGDRVLNVSIGTGSNLPYRLGAWPEVVVVTLRHRPEGV